MDSPKQNKITDRSRKYQPGDDKLDAKKVKGNSIKASESAEANKATPNILSAQPDKASTNYELVQPDKTAANTESARRDNSSARIELAQPELALNKQESAKAKLEQVEAKLKILAAKMKADPNNNNLLLPGLDSILEEHYAEEKPNLGYRRDVLRAQLQHFSDELYANEPEEDTPAASVFVKPWDFTETEERHCTEIQKVADKGEHLRKDFRTLGLILDAVKAKSALLISGFRKVNPITWGKTGTLKGTQVLVHGLPVSGKTDFFDKLLRINDCDDGYPHGAVERYSSSSGKGLLFSGGEDGRAMSGKLIGFEEMKPEHHEFCEFVWSNTTAGFSKHLSSSEGEKRKRRTSQAYFLHGPLHILVTTVSSPNEWDHQFTSRSMCIPFQHSKETVYEVCANKVNPEQESVSYEEKQLILRSWNCFLANLRKLDPSDDTAFADIDMNEILKHIKNCMDKESLGTDAPRRFDILKMLIASHAIVHQNQRKTKKRADGRDILIADKDDLNGVVEVFNQFVITTSRSNVCKADVEAFRICAPWFLHEEHKVSHTQMELEIKLDKSERSIRNYLSAWKGVGLVEIAEVGPKGVLNYKLGPMFDTAKEEILKDVDAQDAGIISKIIEKALEMTAKQTAGFQLKPMR